MRRVSPSAALLVPALLLLPLAAVPAGAHEQRAGAGEPAEVPASGELTVVGTEFEFSPGAVRVEQGRHVTLVFRNEGSLSHNLTIPDLGVHTDTIQSGATDTVEFTARKTGTYPFWCSVPGHEEAGMRGRLRVR